MPFYKGRGDFYRTARLPKRGDFWSDLSGIAKGVADIGIPGVSTIASGVAIGAQAAESIFGGGGGTPIQQEGPIVNTYAAPGDTSGSSMRPLPPGWIDPSSDQARLMAVQGQMAPSPTPGPELNLYSQMVPPAGGSLAGYSTRRQRRRRGGYRIMRRHRR